MSIEDRPANAPNPYAEPTQASDPEPPRPNLPAGQKPAGTARRLAGAFLILNAVMVLIEAAILPASGGTRSPAFGIVPAIFDIVIGVTLVRGSAALATLAIVRTVLGMTLGLALRAQEGPVLIVYQIVFSVSILGLLIGEADRARTAIAGSAVGLCLMLEMVGVASIASGGNVLAPYLMAMSGDTEMPAVERSEGRTAPYQLTFPNRRWYERKRAAVAKDNPIADRWFVRPDKDAHILVIAEHAPKTPLPIDAYVDAVIDGARKDTKNLQVTGRGTWPAFPDNGRLVNISGNREGMSIVWHYAFITAYERAFYIVGLASPENMPEVEDEIRQIFDSFKLPAAILEAVPEELEPTPLHKLTGDLLPYTLTLVDDHWRARKPEVMKRENASLDRWISWFELDAHVIVIAEQVDKGTDLPLDAYTAAVLSTAKQSSTRFEELRREPWAKFPKNGVRVRVSLTRDGTDLEYDYGIYARGNIAFQVIGFSSKQRYPAAEKQLTRAVDSFEPPPP